MTKSRRILSKSSHRLVPLKPEKPKKILELDVRPPKVLPLDTSISDVVFGPIKCKKCGKTMHQSDEISNRMKTIRTYICLECD